MSKKLFVAVKNKVKQFQPDLGINVDYLLSGSFWLSSSGAIMGLLSLFFSWVLTTYLTKQDYGLFQFFLSVMGIIYLFSISGTKTALIVGLSKNYDGSYSFMTKKKFLFSLLGSLSLLFVSFYLYYFVGEYWEYFLLSVPFFPFLYSFSTYEQAFVAKKAFKKRFKALLLRYLGIWVGVAAICFFTRDIFYTIIGYLILYSLAEVITYFVGKKLLKNKKVDKSSFRYAVQLSWLSIIPIIAQSLDKMIIGFYFGLVEIANYSLSLLLAEKSTFFSSVIRSLVLPKMSEHNVASVYKNVSKKLKWVLLFNVVFVLGLCLVFPFVIYYLFPKYDSIVGYTVVFILSHIVTYPSMILTSFFHSQKRFDVVKVFTLYSSIVKIALFLIAAPLYGLWGIIGVFVILRLSRGVYYYYMFIKEGKRFKKKR